MANMELEGLLRQALLQAALADHGEALAQTEEPPFSPRYLRQRLRLMADPQRWSRKRIRPVWRRGLRGAACFVLVCVLSYVAVLAVSPTARARFVAWVTTWAEV